MVEYSEDDLLAVTASRQLEDGKIVFAGVGTALLASILARANHAPHLTVVVEGGVIGPEIMPGELPISTNEMRVGRHAMLLTGITDLFLLAQAGFFDYGFLGGAQIDPFGNINTSQLGPRNKPSMRLPGTGGANDIASHCKEVLIVTMHERRRFVERVDFVTSPGKRARRVITNLALLDFHPVSHRMRVIGLQPGVDLDEVRSSTAFELEVAAEVTRLEPPSSSELAALRALDPARGRARS